jgi:hypothetical protein
MSFVPELDFAIDTIKHRNYEDEHCLKRCDYGFFWSSLFWSSLSAEVCRGDLNVAHNITTKVEVSDNVLFDSFREQYIMALDCDTYEDMVLARAYLLKNTNYKYHIIVSSFDNLMAHYWIICDFVSDINSVIDIMGKIPGVDKRFVSFCKYKKIINLRACPKNFCLPLFYYEDCLDATTNPHVSQWVKNLEAFWRSSEMNILLKKMISLHNKQSYVESIGSFLPVSLLKQYRNIVVGEEKSVKNINAMYGLEVGFEL